MGLVCNLKGCKVEFLRPFLLHRLRTLRINLMIKSTPRINVGAKRDVDRIFPHQYHFDMAKMLGYMITWTTYGSWLQGDKRGYVKDSRILAKNESLRKGNTKRLKADPLELNHREREIVYEAIVDSAKILGQKIHAIVVCSNHVHIVAQRTSESIEMVVSRYKNAARLALQANGFVDRVWTRGFDKRFCFDQQQLQSRIKYVQAHREQPV